MSGANGEEGAGFGEWDTLRRHVVRLQTIVELGVIGEPPQEQARRILADTASALEFDYAELGQESPDEEFGYKRLCAVGDGTAYLPGMGWRGLDREKPYIVFDTLHDETASDPVAATLGLRSLLFWPFTAGAKRCVLSFGWKESRSQFVSEEVIGYLNFLAALISRLLLALEQQRLMAQRADTDALTGIPNRAAVLDSLSRAIFAAQREEGSIGLLYIDLNNFKHINDAHGHGVGDRTLSDVARRIQSVLRRNELCGRIGGDEFCVVVSRMASEDELTVICRRVLDAVGEPIAIAGEAPLRPSASIGIAVYPRDGTTPNELLEHADMAMYRAKSLGTGTYAFYAPREGTAIKGSISVENTDMDSAFLLCYQPIVGARNGRPVAAEVLPRWLHPGGMRSPEAVVREAAQQGRLRDLDLKILRAVLERAPEVRQIAGIAFHVNISEPNSELLDALPADAAPIAFEVSEERVGQQADQYVKFFASCRERGVRAGLSDFGSGHISIRTLAELRPDFVKVSARGDAVRMLVDHAHNFAATVIGEAIETSEERQVLVASGVDAVQGFEISSPLAEQDFLTWLRRYRSAAIR